MQYVPFGKFGFDVSRLGMGAMRMPTIQKDGKTVLDRPEAIALIRAAIDGGINYVDTAYGYHDGESEIVTGLALKDGYRERVTLTTKLPHWAIKEEEDLDVRLDEQLRKLDVPYLDFYIIHALGKDSFAKMQSLHYKEFLNRAIKDGRIRHTGFSFHDDAETFIKIIDDYDNWGLAQIQLNYLDDQHQATVDGMRYAGKKGVPVVVMEPLRGGALATPPADVTELITGHPSKRSPVEWAFAYVADFPEVVTILSGMSNLQQLNDNLAIFDRLTVGCMSEADKAFAKQLKEKYLARMPIGCTRCNYCQPCPQDVKIPRIFSAYNNARMFDNDGEFRYHYRQLLEQNGDAARCVQCGACETACPQHIEIIDWLQKVHGVYEKGI